MVGAAKARRRLSLRRVKKEFSILYSTHPGRQHRPRSRAIRCSIFRLYAVCGWLSAISKLHTTRKLKIYEFALYINSSTVHQRIFRIIIIRKISLQVINIFGNF